MALQGKSQGSPGTPALPWAAVCTCSQRHPQQGPSLAANHKARQPPRLRAPRWAGRGTWMERDSGAGSPPQGAPGEGQRTPNLAGPAPPRCIQASGCQPPPELAIGKPNCFCRVPRPAGGTCFLAHGSYQFHRATPSGDGSSQRFIHPSGKAGRGLGGGGDEEKEEEGRWLLFLFY